MHKLLVGCVLVSAAIVATPTSASTKDNSNKVAPATSNSSGPAGTAVQPAANAEKKICRLLSSSYSHARDRVCLTENEWKQVEEE